MIEQTKDVANRSTPAVQQGSERQRGARLPGRRRSGSSTPLEWLLRTRGLRAARAAVPQRSSPAGELLRRARLAFELADRVIDPVEPLRAGSGAVLAADLFRQSAYWALCVLHHAAQVVPASQFWSSELESELGRTLPDAEALAAARSLLLDATFISLAEQKEDQQKQLAHHARSLASSALERSEQPEKLVERLQWQRSVRVGVLGLVLTTVVVAGVWGSDYLRQGPDLALGKPWRTSSVWGQCDPATKRCGGLKTNVFFHTLEDDSPWIEYDLGAPREFSRVYVRNRTDSVPDRAIPLIVEVSNDQKAYREVARRTMSFRSWTADFGRQRARYVRLRVPRRTWLHLARVSIYRPK